MKRLALLFIVATLFVVGQVTDTHAAIVTNGNVIPNDASTWTSDTYAYIAPGTSSTGSVTVTDGDDIISNRSYIGYGTGSLGIITISGAGSTWTNSGDFGVGCSGSGTLDITAGGAVSDNSGSIGAEPGSTGSVTIDGENSTWTNSGILTVGYHGSGTLDITDGGDVSNDDGYIGYASGLTGTVTVDGAGSTWTNSGKLNIGYYGSGVLDITAGGAVSNDSYACIGYDSGSTGAVTVSGTGSTWSSSSSLSVHRGTLNITAGGAVSNANYAYIGFSSAATSMVSVDGAGSTWTNSGGLYVGYYGSGGTLGITAGGAVSNTKGLIGYESGSAGAITVDGAGSTWTNSSYLYVGCSGSGTLDITDGGAVSNTYGYIGGNSDSTGEVTVDGEGSSWTNSNDLYVGYDGSGTLNITNGGAVSVAGATHIADGANATGVINFGESGGGTLTTQTLFCTSFSQLTGTGTINANGIVSDCDLLIFSGSDLTMVLNGQENQNVSLNLSGMSDSGNAGDLGVGYRGNGTLSIGNGMAIYSRDSYLGYSSGSSGTATISGAGSTWTNNDSLYVGYDGNGTLDITDGGAVSNTYCGYIGCYSGSGKVTVDGAGSSLTNGSYFYVGLSGNGMLDITNGGAVSNAYSGSIGCQSGSSGEVTVDGTGSTWTNSGYLYVGDEGSGTFNITNGGAVSSNYYCYIGNESGSLGEVTVDGTGSTWTNRGNLYVGRSGNGTLDIADDGLVSVAGTLTIDYEGDGDSFINMADGGMLALAGQADGSLAAFLDLVAGTDAIQWWDPEIADWNLLGTATLGEDYTLEYLTDGDLSGYTLLTVTAIEPEAGDANCDGRVDGSDVTILAGNWQYGIEDGETANWAMGDFNGDGQVDGSDVTILAGNWQSGVGASNTAVPEPAMVASLLILLGTALALTIKKR